MDLVVRGRTFRNGRVERADVAVSHGRIIHVAPAGSEAERIGPLFDAGDLVIMPGGVDAHVHFRDPGHPEKEDWASGSLSALMGGVTTVLDMPNTLPPTTTVEAFEEKLKRAREKSFVDFGLFAGLAGEESLEVIPRATALKIYLGATTGHLLARDRPLIERAIEVAAREGKVVAFHAEDQGCLERHHAPESRATDFAAHSRARPPGCERDAVEFIKALARPAGAKLHVCHLSSADGLAALRGSRVSAEVTPHHLLLAIDDLVSGTFKMNPPLREARDRETLWRAFAAGEIDALASDHAPHTPDEKRKSVWEAPAGVPGVETLVPLLMARAAKGEVSLETLARASAERPGEIYGLPKGRIAPGYDADFAFYDLAAIEPVRAENLHSRAGWTPFEGREAIFPRHVMIRGRFLVEDRELVVSRGEGRFLYNRR